MSLMSHADFAQYQQAFNTFIDCARSTLSKEACGVEWSHAVAGLLAKGASAEEAAQGAAYYADMLRTNGGRSKYCEAAKTA